MLAILIPTFKRPQRIGRIIKNIQETTKGDYNIYFIIEREDRETIEELKKHEDVAVIYNIAPYTYVSAINLAYKSTREPFVFCGADDIVFSDGWDAPIIKAFQDKKLGIVGSIDSWGINQTGLHASHFAVRREYIETQGGVQDEKGKIYYSGYKHYECDVETIQTAIKRGVFYQAKDSVVEHNHYYNGKAEKDETYNHARTQSQGDSQTYEERRRSFEQYHYGHLWKGKKLRVNQGKLSIILPSYNCTDYLKQTINSLLANTYHDFELIIIDDCSEPDTIEFLKKIEDSCTVIYNKEQKYVTYNWNLGIHMATGDYIAIVNNDIEMSKDWDIFLMNALDDEVVVASPYQKVPQLGGRTMSSLEIYDTIKRFGHPHICGPCFMFKKELIDLIGYFPPQFKIWSNDSWISWVCTTIYGKKIVDVKDAVCTHYGSKSSQNLEEKKKLLRLITQEDVKLWYEMRDSFATTKNKKYTPYRYTGGI